MPLPSLLDWLKPYLPGGAQPGPATPTASAKPEGRSELTTNAEKTLAMKRQADAEERSHIPSHRTANEGMRPSDDPNAREADPDFASRRKRTGGARPGEAS